MLDGRLRNLLPLGLLNFEEEFPDQSVVLAPTESSRIGHIHVESIVKQLVTRLLVIPDRVSLVLQMRLRVKDKVVD